MPLFARDLPPSGVPFHQRDAIPFTIRLCIQLR